MTIRKHVMQIMKSGFSNLHTLGIGHMTLCGFLCQITQQYSKSSLKSHHALHKKSARGLGSWTQSQQMHTTISVSVLSSKDIGVLCTLGKCFIFPDSTRLVKHLPMLIN